MANRNKIISLMISCLIMNCVAAQLMLPAIIGDNMVLQRSMKTPVWGWASPKEKISISFKNKTYTTVTAQDGKWLLKLDANQAGGPFQMTVKGKDSTIIVNNILIGEVWLASGQSNMEFGIQTESHSVDAIAHATDSLIHFFYVPMASSLQPMDDIATTGNSLNGSWLVCSPELLSKNWAWHGFSAVGYYFAKEMRKTIRVPVGMIGSYKGGTPAQAWISLPGLQQDTLFSHYITVHQKLLDNCEQAKSEYPQKQAAFQATLKQWNIETGKAYDSVMAIWQKTLTRSKTTGEPVPLSPQPASPRPQAPTPPDGGFGAPANLYNAMISPIVPYAIKGVIWYQGESNGDKLTDALEYPILFPRLITDWRRQWNEGAFPFLFVQLANFRSPAKTASEGIWPWVRDAQLKTLALPNTGMAVTTDIGDSNNIHPVNKLDVGFRLALAARHIAYKENITYSGPVYKSMKVMGNKIRLTFTHNDNGLMIGTESGSPAAITLKGFGIAGADRKFVWAKAVMEDNTVVVYTDEILQPVTVRYNWADNPPGNLYNKEGLPASPFRTDSWPGITKPKL